MTRVEGFWLPKDIRAKLLDQSSEFGSESYRLGKPCLAEDHGAVTAFWPRFSLADWKRLLELLGANQQRVPTGPAFWQRLQAALLHCEALLSDENNPLHKQALDLLPSYTGYSEPMIRSMLSAFQLLTLPELPAVFQSSPSLAATRSWQRLDNLPGRWRFFQAPFTEKFQSFLPLLDGRRLYRQMDFPELVVGFGAGNVPGNALLIALLSLASTLTGEPAPALLIRNSRQEPIFTPIVLNALEQFDPDLVCSTVVIVWDYADSALQNLVLGKADLVVAAASDETINQILAELRSLHRSSDFRLHAHGHKVSFAAIDSEMFDPRLVDTTSGQKILEIITFLAALDSVFWDQYGCLSARVHFVENTGQEKTNSMEYCRLLGQQLGLLARILPRGAWPRQSLHNSFDRYRQLESTGEVKIFSRYDDDFLLVHDARKFNPAAFISQVNECQGRVIVVRPVDGLDEIHQRFLSCISPSQLQSLSVATGRPGQDLDARFLRFAESCGARGITAIRTVGRAAFPQLAYSWDGLLPIDLAYSRRGGYFTTIEFDRPLDQIIETHQMMMKGWKEGG